MDAAREWLLGARAEQRAARVPEDTRRTASRYRRIALGRARARAELGDPAAAIVLLRDAVTALALAAASLAGRDGAPESAVDTLLTEHGGQAWAERVRRVFDAHAFGAVDELSPAELYDKRVALEQAVHWLAGRVDPRGPAELRRRRRLLIVALGLGVPAALAALVLAITAPVDVARGKPVTASSQQPGTPSGAALVDGRPSRSFGIHTRREPSPWVAVDLGRSVRIARIEIQNRRDGRLDESLPLTVELSSDGAHYTPLATRTTRFDLWVIPAGDRSARWVRLTSRRDRGVIVLDELRVLAR